MFEGLLTSTLLVLSIALACQGGFTLYLMLYTWWQPERQAQTRSPEVFAAPTLRFTALLPARHEQEVIAETINRVWGADYPHELLEIVVICERGDGHEALDTSQPSPTTGGPQSHAARTAPPDTRRLRQ